MPKDIIYLNGHKYRAAGTMHPVEEAWNKGFVSSNSGADPQKLDMKITKGLEQAQDLLRRLPARISQSRIKEICLLLEQVAETHGRKISIATSARKGSTRIALDSTLDQAFNKGAHHNGDFDLRETLDVQAQNQAYLAKQVKLLPGVLQRKQYRGESGIPAMRSITKTLAKIARSHGQISAYYAQAED